MNVKFSDALSNFKSVSSIGLAPKIYPLVNSFLANLIKPCDSQSSLYLRFKAITISCLLNPRFGPCKPSSNS